MVNRKMMIAMKEEMVLTVKMRRRMRAALKKQGPTERKTEKSTKKPRRRSLNFRRQSSRRR